MLTVISWGGCVTSCLFILNGRIHESGYIKEVPNLIYPIMETLFTSGYADFLGRCRINPYT